ncbi:helix-turn-helix transcriptional regulator [Alkalibacillus silvisoli]|uniref:HTH cro/C1-type domain-containing protein n=1 Tax=Alkalibacillus silvisoli TaxID=392823 RepID=A0ABN0ZYM3_9BACI
MESQRRYELIKARKDIGFFQKDVVALLSKDHDIKITESYYGMIEQGVRTPNLILALSISKVLSKDPEQFF